METIASFLSKRKRDGALRSLYPVESRDNGGIVVEGVKYVDFSSNDYLGLSQHPLLIKAGMEAIQNFGFGSSASRLMTGDLALFHSLEKKIAEFKKKESALVFNSGYQANVGIISSLFKREDAIFSDRLSHASLLDGIILSGAKLFRFRHNDMFHLEELLKQNRANYRNCLIVTEGVFSMDGDEPPLNDLVGIKDKYNCLLMLDEAHATGIYGENGAGIAEKYNLQDKVDLLMGTFSKALGGFGAYLGASKQIIDYLVNACRGFIYSTALPPSVAAANIAALDVVKNEPWRRKHLVDISLYFRSRLKEIGVVALGSSQIVPIIVGDNFKALDLAARLKQRGFWVMAVRPPTVPEGQARLRLSLSVYHSKDIVDGFIDDIKTLGI